MLNNYLDLGVVFDPIIKFLSKSSLVYGDILEFSANYHSPLAHSTLVWASYDKQVFAFW